MDIHVVCAVFREGSSYLIARRPQQADLGGYWEFPGGKIESGETPQTALEREILEELGVRILVKDELGHSSTSHHEGQVILTAYMAEKTSGVWTLKFHTEMRWVEILELRTYTLAPADIPFIDMLLQNQWPIKLKVALALKDEGKSPEALSILQKLAKDNPQAGLVHYHLGVILEELSRKDESLVAYEKAISGDISGTTRRQVYAGLSFSYRSRGLYQRALDSAEKALIEFPESGELEVCRAMALYNLGRHAEAFPLLLQLVASRTDDGNIRLYQNAFLFYANQLDKIWT